MSGSAAVLTAADLVGVWHLRSWESAGADGIQLPMGEHPEGVVVYTADGTMITTIGRAGRTPIDGGDLAGGPVDQRLEAMSSFIAYSGTFRIEGGDVLHSVTMSLFPNWVGTAQRRHVALANGGRLLTLSADPFLLRGRLSSQALVWERVGD